MELKKNRIYYLDNLKAICILSVIASHVNSFVFSNGGCFMNKIFDTFFMGTFFMVSGFLGYKSFTDKVSLKDFAKIKVYNLLIPLFMVGSFYVICHDIVMYGNITENPLSKMIMNGDQMGYWFLLTLFVFKMMALLTGFVTNAFKIIRNKVCNHTAQLVTFAICGGAILGVVKILTAGYEHWYMCFSSHIMYYMLFYYVGSLLHRLELLQRLQSMDVLMAALFVMGVVLCECYQLADLRHPLILITMYRMCIVLPLFVYFSKFMDKPMKFFTSLGVCSLELYVFHYFVIIGCSSYSAAWICEIKNMPFLFQLIINTIMTCMIAVITMQIAKVINNNKFAKKMILGKM